MNFFQPLFTLSFWFSYHAKPFSPWTTKVILVISALLVLGGVIALIWKRAIRDQVLRHHIADSASMMIVMGVTSLFLWFVTYEGVPFLSMRIFWLLWLGIVIWWSTVLLRDYRIAKAQRVMTHDPEREAYEKYLPKPKKK